MIILLFSLRDFFNQCMVVHTTEGAIGFFISKIWYKQDWTTAFKWTLSTFVNGMFSLWYFYRIPEGANQFNVQKRRPRPKRE